MTTNVINPSNGPTDTQDVTGGDCGASTCSEFLEFPKIARLSRECIITEKIDGTNGQIYIGEKGEFLVGSRSRWITPEDDNYGFARWAHEHREELMTLGVGRHFGEWWGQGVQRKYNMPEKRWSLFNVARWCLHGETPQRIQTADPRIEKWQDVLPACCHLVPVLYHGIFDTARVEEALADLRENGSKASPGFMKPEGVICFHIAGNFGFKKTLEKDEAPKGYIFRTKRSAHPATKTRNQNEH